MEINIDTLLDITNDNGNPEVAYNMGVFLIQKALYKEAKEKFDKALLLKPDYILALTARAQCSLMLKEFSKALEDCSSALKLGDDPFFVNVLISNVYGYMGEIEKAISQLDIALNYKDDAKTYYQRGILKLNMGDDNGIEDIKIAAKNGCEAAIETLNELFPQKDPSEPILRDFEIIRGYRKLAKENNTAPSLETSDEDIVKIYKIVCETFTKIAESRNEKLSTGQINFIAYKFYQVFDKRSGRPEHFALEHLKYELEKYKKYGLREEYKMELEIDTLDWL